MDIRNIILDVAINPVDHITFSPVWILIAAAAIILLVAGGCLLIKKAQSKNSRENTNGELK